MIQQRNIVIIGSSIAGISAAEAARKQDPLTLITVVSRDLYPPYYRMRISEVIDDPSAVDELVMHPPEWYTERQISLVPGVEVTRIDPERHEIYLADGQTMPYTALIIATGSQSFVPPIRGIGRPGVYTLWTLSDALRIEQALRLAKNALVIGGGMLGLEGAHSTRQRGIPTTIVEKAPRLLANQLDEKGSAIFTSRVKNLDITVMANTDITSIEGATDDDSSPVARVRFANGSILETDFILISIGVHAQTEIAQRAGITCGRRILTDETMQTSAADIFAAGDVAEPNEFWFGLWSSSRLQGQVAGTNAAGGTATFELTIPPYLINTMETKIAVQGEKGLQVDPQYTFDVLIDEKNGNYRKLVYRDGVLRGFILVGNTLEFTNLRKAIGEPKKIS